MKPDQDTRVHFGDETICHRLLQAGREIEPSARQTFALRCGKTAEGNVTIWRGPSKAPWADCPDCRP